MSGRTAKKAVAAVSRSVGGGASLASSALTCSKPGVFHLDVRVNPGARTTSVVKPTTMLEPLQIRVAAPPQEGRANKELVEFLEEALSAGIRRDHGALSRASVDVSVLRGSSARTKIVQILCPESATVEMLWAVLLATSPTI